jgi:pimeloyl-ACP methyl ester carboxylesterase
MSHTQVKVGPHSIAITLAGPSTGPAFLLVHGLGTSRRYFRPLLATLSRRFRVVALDLPGFGNSSRPQRALNISELAAIVGQLMMQEQWENHILVGQSMGCQIVSELLQQHPDLTSKAVLISPTASDRERTARQHAFRLLQDTFQEPLPANAIVFSDFLRCGLPRYLATLRYMLSDHIEERLPTCDANTLIIRGGRDRIVPNAWATKLMTLLPHGSLVQVQQQPHLVHYTAAQKVAELCAQFATRP